MWTRYEQKWPTAATANASSKATVGTNFKHGSVAVADQSAVTWRHEALNASPFI